ncbi:MAG: hypothetical protein CXR30_16270 [Geobacter sp.]|nr:MAG: hypothetical protein CXR30_16270 [Geobacter sp.]
MAVSLNDQSQVAEAAMKTIAILATLLLPAIACAETIIVEYPDHYYVESTGSPANKAAKATENVAPVAKPSPAPFRDSNASLGKPVDAAERKSALTNELARLQREHDELATPKAGDTPEQISNKQQAAYAKLMKMRRITSVLQKMSDQER